MKFIWSVLLVAVCLVSSAQAQEASVGPLVLGGDFGLSPKVTKPSFGTADGKSIPVNQDSGRPWAAYLGYKPVGKLGFEVRGKKFGTEANAVGSSNGLVVWGTDIAPLVISTSSTTKGPQNYTLGESQKFSQIDLLANYTLGLRSTTVGLFAGVSSVNYEETQSAVVSQKFLLTSKLPGGATDPTADRETYTATSSASLAYRGIGPTVGAEGELCILRGLVLEGRGAFTDLLQVRGDGIGQFSYVKGVDLVNTVDGINGPAKQTVATLNLAPSQKQFRDTTSQSAIATDLKLVLKVRLQLSRQVAMDIGGGISRVSFHGRGSPEFMVPAAESAGQGTWSPRSTDLSVVSPIMTVNLWF